MRIADTCLQHDSIAWGTYHYCNRPATTWYGFAQAIFRQAEGFDGLKLKPITSADYPTPARRPSNSVLDCSSIDTTFGIGQEDWREELTAVLVSFESVGKM